MEETESHAIDLDQNVNRVKLYGLEEEGAWTDRGTGFVSCCSTKDGSGTALVVVNEFEPCETLLESKIQLHSTFELQGGKLL